MKKIMLILLLLSILLCGCSNSASDDSKENDFFQSTQSQQNSNKNDFFQGTQMQQNSNKNMSAVILQITINPVFTIYLDENDSILEIACVNEDADMLFADIDVVGMTYQEAMPVILDTAYEMEFITADTTEIKMEITIQEDIDEAQMDALSSSLKAPITEFQEEKELVLEVNASDILEGITVVDIFDEDNNLVGKNYFNLNGVLIKSIYDYAGYYICTEYDANGVCIKHVENNSNNYLEYYYDKDGKKTNDISIYYATGVRTESTYYKNGNRKTIIQYSPDGTYAEHYFDENGIIQKFISYELDGGRHEQYYYENGNIQKSIYDASDGTHSEESFYENGNRKSSISDNSEGIHFEVYYYENGNMKSNITDYPDGRHEEFYHDENGNIKKAIYVYPDGRYVEYDGDGNLISE